MTTNKKILRLQMRETRSTLTFAERQKLDTIIIKKFLSHPVYKAASIVMAYVSMPEEIQLREVFQDCFDAQKTLAVPLIIKGEMFPVIVPNFDALEIGDFGIATVKKNMRRLIDAEKIDCIIVPGVAFDNHGNRLGMGGGFYDKFLPTAINAKKIALAYDFQIVEELPVEPHDLPVDIIITDNKLIERS